MRRVTDQEAREQFGIRWNPAADCAGILFPYYIPPAEWRVAARVRRDHPEEKDGKPENKYLSPWIRLREP